jgi:hypothetical protein
MSRTLAVLLALALVAGCTRREDPPPNASAAAAVPQSASGDATSANASGAAATDPYPGAPTSTAYPPGGSYAKVQYVILAASEPGEILYTTDGTTPVRGAPGTRSGRNPVFWIRVGAGTTTITWFAVDDAGNRGATEVATYEVKLP